MVKHVNNTHLHKWMCRLCGSRRKDIIPIISKCDQVEGVIMICRNCHNVKFFMTTDKMMDLLHGELEYHLGPTEKVGPSNLEDYDVYRHHPYEIPDRHIPPRRIIDGEYDSYVVTDRKPLKPDRCVCPDRHIPPRRIIDGEYDSYVVTDRKPLKPDRCVCQKDFHPSTEDGIRYRKLLNEIQGFNENEIYGQECEFDQEKFH